MRRQGFFTLLTVSDKTGKRDVKKLLSGYRYVICCGSGSFEIGVTQNQNDYWYCIELSCGSSLGGAFKTMTAAIEDARKKAPRVLGFIASNEYKKAVDRMNSAPIDGETKQPERVKKGFTYDLTIDERKNRHVIRRKINGRVTPVPLIMAYNNAPGSIASSLRFLALHILEQAHDVERCNDFVAQDFDIDIEIEKMKHENKPLFAKEA